MRRHNPETDANVETGDNVAFKLDGNNGVSIVNEKSPVSSNNACMANHNVDETTDEAEFVPPDGGLRAWMVMLSAFLCNSILFGIINTYGSIYLTLQEQMKLAGEKDASSKAGKFCFLTSKFTFSCMFHSDQTSRSRIVSSALLYCISYIFEMERSDANRCLSTNP